MARRHISYLILVLHTITSRGIDALEFSKKISLGDNPDTLYVSHPSASDDEGFRYTVCKSVTHSRIHKGNLTPYPASVNCTLHLLTPDRDRACNVTYEKADESRFIQEMAFGALGTSKILVSSDENADDDGSRAIHYHFFRIVNFDDCSQRSLSLPRDINFYEVSEDLTIHPDHFHLLLYGKDPMCGGLDRCRITFDLNGNQVGGPVANPFKYTTSFGISASTGSTDRGFFAYGEEYPIDKFDYFATYTSANGTLEFTANLSSISVPEGPNHYQSEVKWPTMTSHASDLYGLCGELTTGNDTQKLWCLQYDWKTGQSANFTFEESTVRRRHKSQFEIAAFANLGLGSILFINIDCEGGSVCKQFHVSTVNRDGQVQEKISTPMHLKCSNFYRFLRAGIVEVKNEFCFKFTCIQDDYAWTEMQLNIFMKCIPKDQL